ncbi:vitamin K epoxide reductase family protein [Kribbella antibiotica]|uniref:vitamin K epoxide reductase family protein n=1 Tax=Kribbella antibiotica TaxID=190195 RepID=UPI001EE080BA|nr:vitamin K epoxide reductase family protein [Kribbella antibiotica]
MSTATARGTSLGVIPWATLAVSALGVLVSAYLTYEHFTAGTTLACPETGVVNCFKVTSSQYSKLFGVPVALLGLLFFIGMVVLSLPALWRTASPWPSRARLAGVTVGVVFVLYLVWAELFRINAICLWCTVVHGLTLILFALVVIRVALPPIED